MLPQHARFSASCDRTAEIATTVVCAGLLLASAATQNLIVASVSAPLVFLAFAYSPRGYAVGETTACSGTRSSGRAGGT